MKIIMLIGESDCGKTTAIRKVYDEMVRYAKEPKPDIPDEGDIDAVLTHRSGQRIGFHSEGDTSAVLIKAMRDHNDNKCDILVCACNESLSDPHGTARLLAREYYTPIYKEKAPESEWAAANEEYKNLIITLIVSFASNHKLIAIV
jgi:hypothetical protein